MLPQEVAKTQQGFGEGLPGGYPAIFLSQGSMTLTGPSHRIPTGEGTPGHRAISRYGSCKTRKRNQSPFLEIAD